MHRTGDPPAGGRTWWCTDVRATITVVAGHAQIGEISRDAPCGHANPPVWDRRASVRVCRPRRTCPRSRSVGRANACARSRPGARASARSSPSPRGSRGRRRTSGSSGCSPGWRLRSVAASRRTSSSRRARWTSRRATWAAAPCPRACAGPPTRAAGGGRARRRTARSGSPTACAGCRAGCSTTSCCTSSTHLLHAGHGPDFWAELDAYPRTARARGFLEGYAYRADRPGGVGRRRRTTRPSTHRRRARSSTIAVDGRLEARALDEEFSDDAVRRGRGLAARVRLPGAVRGSGLVVRVLAEDLGERAVDLGRLVDGGRATRRVTGRVVQVLACRAAGRGGPRRRRGRRGRCRGRSAPRARRRRAAGGAAARGRRGWRTSARRARPRRGGGGSSRAAPWCAAGAGAPRWTPPRRPTPRPGPARSRAVRGPPTCSGVVCGANTPPDSACCRAAVSVGSIAETASSSWSTSIVMPRAYASTVASRCERSHGTCVNSRVAAASRRARKRRTSSAGASRPSANASTLAATSAGAGRSSSGSPMSVVPKTSCASVPAAWPTCMPNTADPSWRSRLPGSRPGHVLTRRGRAAASRRARRPARWTARTRPARSACATWAGSPRPTRRGSTRAGRRSRAAGRSRRRATARRRRARRAPACVWWAVSDGSPPGGGLLAGEVVGHLPVDRLVAGRRQERLDLGDDLLERGRVVGQPGGGGHGGRVEPARLQLADRLVGTLAEHGAHHLLPGRDAVAWHGTELSGLTMSSWNDCVPTTCDDGRRLRSTVTTQRGERGTVGEQVRSGRSPRRSPDARARRRRRTPRRRRRGRPRPGRAGGRGRVVGPGDDGARGRRAARRRVPSDAARGRVGRGARRAPGRPGRDGQPRGARPAEGDRRAHPAHPGGRAGCQRPRTSSRSRRRPCTAPGPTAREIHDARRRRRVRRGLPGRARRRPARHGGRARARARGGRARGSRSCGPRRWRARASTRSSPGTSRRRGCSPCAAPPGSGSSCTSRTSPRPRGSPWSTGSPGR